MKKQNVDSMKEATSGEVTCPNCGSHLQLLETDRDTLQSLGEWHTTSMVLIPGLIALPLGLVHLLLCKRFSWNFDFAPSMAVVIIPFIIMLRIVPSKVLRHEKKEGRKWDIPSGALPAHLARIHMKLCGAQQ